MSSSHNNVMNTTLAPIMSGWQWWTDELSSLWRELFTDRAVKSADILHFKTDGDLLHISTRQDKIWQELEQVPLNRPKVPPQDIETSPQDIKNRIMSVIPLGQWRTVVHLPREYCLVKPLAFPKVALNDIKDILAHQIDRLVPYPADQVYFDYRLNPEAYTEDKIKLTLFIVPKVRCEGLFSLLKDCGVTVDSIELANVTSRPVDEINLRSREGAHTSNRKVNPKIWAAVAGLCLLAILPTAYNHYRISAIEDIIGLSKSQALSSTRLKQDVESLKKNARYLIDKKKSRPLTIEVVSQISTLLGDNTWLEQLTVRKDEIQLFGYSATASEVLEDLESSSLFSNAHFLSAVVQQKEKNVERFQVAADVKLPPSPNAQQAGAK